MKKFISYSIVGIAGYLIGFYEMKYKTLKIFVEHSFKDKEEKKEEES